MTSDSPPVLRAGCLISGDQLPDLMKFFFALLCCLSFGFCSSQPASNNPGIVEILDRSALQWLDPTSAFDTLASGFSWSEGPLYIGDGDFWLFSDVPENKVYKIGPDNALSVFLAPSGYTGTQPRGGEPGSNGLLLDPQGRLVLMQHGDRRVARMKAKLQAPKPEFESVITHFEGKRFNSPNDGVFDREGNLYFTDPPYGLEQGMDDPAKETRFQGVYCLLKSGELLLVDSLSRPNGLALTPDESTLLVAVSDPQQAAWYRYPLQAPGQVKTRQLFYDATALVGQAGYVGLPDGMKMHPSGSLFASGPGGIWVFDQKGKAVARVKTGQATSNCAFSGDWKTLLITADAFIFALEIK